MSYPDGRRSYIKPGRILGWHSRRGYQRVVLSEPNRGKREEFVHVLVLKAFIGPCPDGTECCHNDGNPANNAISNLRWDTRSGNIFDAVRHGTHHSASKTHCKRGHVFDKENTIQRRGGGRFCRECMRMYGREHARKKFGHKPRVYRSDMTECRHGHPITPENTYTYPSGEQSCRRCRALAMQRYKERKRLEEVPK